MKINTKNLAKNEEDFNVSIINNIEEFQDKLKQNKTKEKIYHHLISRIILKKIIQI